MDGQSRHKVLLLSVIVHRYFEGFDSFRVANYLQLSCSWYEGNFFFLTCSTRHSISSNFNILFFYFVLFVLSVFGFEFLSSPNRTDKGATKQVKNGNSIHYRNCKRWNFEIVIWFTQLTCDTFHRIIFRLNNSIWTRWQKISKFNFV